MMFDGSGQEPDNDGGGVPVARRVIQLLAANVVVAMIGATVLATVLGLLLAMCLSWGHVWGFG